MITVVTNNSVGTPGANGASGTDATSPSIVTPSLHLSQSDGVIIQSGSHVTYSVDMQFHTVDQTASFVG